VQVSSVTAADSLPVCFVKGYPGTLAVKDQERVIGEWFAMAT
jgi:hypothetical protein